MIQNANVIKKVFFPRIIIPTSAILVSLLDFLITYVVYAVLLLWFQVKIHIPEFILFSTACFLLTLFSTLGLGLVFAAINIRYRDARHAIPFLLQLLFFATPIIFPVKLIQSKLLLFIISLNPITAAIHFARVAISIESTDWTVAVIGAVLSIVLMVIGLFLFNKNEIDCADIL